MNKCYGCDFESEETVYHHEARDCAAAWRDRAKQLAGELDETRKVCAEVAEQLARWKHYTPDWAKLEQMIRRLTDPFQK